MSTHGSFPYCDGETLQTRLVELDWQPDGGVRILDGTDSTTISADDFSISESLGSIPRFLRIVDGGVIELPLNSPIPGLAAYEKKHSLARVVHWLESRASIAALATALVILIVAAGFWQGLPRLCRRIAYAVPVSIEQAAGEAAFKVLRTAFHRSQLDFLARERVRRQLERLTAVNPPHVPPKLIFLVMGSPNAFALPGGTIVVADELVKYATTDEEIAAVLAHELGHIEQRHGLQSVLRSSAALVVVSTLTGDLSTLSTFSATLPFLLLQYGYAREFETEADGFAVALLQKTGINPDSLASILQTLETARGGDGPDFSYLSTHPSTASRVDALYQLSDSGGDADPENEVHELTQPTRVSVVNPEYPDELRERGIKGEVMIDFVVTRSGDVVQAKVVHATHPLFGEAAAKAVTQWKFNPGKVGTRRVNTRMQQPVTFSLEEEISPIAPTQVRVEAGNNED